MTVFLLESYVKLLTSKTEGMLLYVFIMFETYAKSNTSKTNVETLEFDRV